MDVRILDLANIWGLTKEAAVVHYSSLEKASVDEVAYRATLVPNENNDIDVVTATAEEVVEAFNKVKQEGEKLFWHSGFSTWNAISAALGKGVVDADTIYHA